MTDQLAADERDDGSTTSEFGDDERPAVEAADAGAANEASDGNDTDGNDAGAAASTGRFGMRRKRQRISKWDRPPDPHDWRFYVGTLGKVLIATGVMLFGFVAYQLWGTGIETARAQNRLENQFEELLAEVEVVDDDSPSTDTDVDRPTTSAVDETGDDDPVDSDAVDSDDADSDSATSGDPEIVVGPITEGVPIATDLAEEAVEQTPIPQPSRGDPLLRLEIPAIGRDDIVVPGVSLNDLKDGPGHYPDTPLPGQLGNASIAGHRTTYGAPFFNVDELVPGDEIITTLTNGDRFVYEVTFVEVVSASDYWVVTTRDPSIAELTLTSCHPKYTARDRIVVHSVLDPAKSANVGFPTFYSLDADPDEAPITGDDPVLSADGIEITGPDSALGELDPEATTDPDPADSGSQAPADEGAAESAADGEVAEPRPVADDELAESRQASAPAEPIDAFSQGWFDDRDAFPQIALWGILLTLISLLSYQVSKKFRHDSIGFLFGIAPFLFALYFFYQNVNRLLPPGI